MSNYLSITIEDDKLSYRQVELPDNLEHYVENRLTGNKVETVIYKKVVIHFMDYDQFISFFVDKRLLDTGISIKDIAYHILEFEKKLTTLKYKKQS